MRYLLLILSTTDECHDNYTLTVFLPKCRGQANIATYFGSSKLQMHAYRIIHHDGVQGLVLLSIHQILLCYYCSFHGEQILLVQP